MPTLFSRLSRRARQGLIQGLMLLLLTGCQDVELYSELSEREGNEILAVLLAQDIVATKTRAKKFVTILVPQQDVARSIEILRRQGFPRERFTDLGQIFQKQGLISSPMEERVRYTFGLSQMLAETLTQIDGVLSARVLIVVPEEASFGKVTAPSSAAVFVKYQPGMDIEEAVPRIKTLVQNSVDGLRYDNISVALFPQRESVLATEFGVPSAARPQAAPPWSRLTAALGILLMLTLGTSVYLWWRLRRQYRLTAADTHD